RLHHHDRTGTGRRSTRGRPVVRGRTDTDWRCPAARHRSACASPRRTSDPDTVRRLPREPSPSACPGRDRQRVESPWLLLQYAPVRSWTDRRAEAISGGRAQPLFTSAAVSYVEVTALV